MTQKRILIPIIAVMLVVGIQQAYAEPDFIVVPFDIDEKTCWLQTETTAQIGTVEAYFCIWLPDLPTDIGIEYQDDFQLDIPEKYFIEAEDKPTIIEKAISPELQAKLDEKREELKGMYDAKEIIESYGAGELDIRKFCFGGTVRESTIFEEHETIEIKRPFDNQPLQTNQQLKYEHLMSEICKAQYKLEYKIENWKRTLPGEGESYVFVPTNVLPKNVTDSVEYKKRFLTEHEFLKTQEEAEEFKCSPDGKARGFCYKEIGDQPIPEPTISNKGQRALDAYWLLRETGEAEIPFKQPEAEFVPTTALDQYIKAYGISEEELKQWYESRNP